MESLDVIVIGAGAAGLMAAGTAAQDGRSVLLLEKMEKSGRKIRITGKGRCNLTNRCTNDEFSQKVRSGREFITAAIENFDTSASISFFESIGLPLIVERGSRVFPSSGKANDVANALTLWAVKMGVQILYNQKVLSVNIENNTVSGVTLADKTISAKNIIIATGGLSYPLTGSDGDGYQFAYDLGHHIEPVRPALVSLDVKCPHLNELSGLVLKNIALSLFVEGECVQSEFGEMEFFKYGIGGAITLKISRNAVDAIIEEKEVEVSIDLKAALSLQKITGRINRELAEKRITVGELLRKLLPPQLITPILSLIACRKNDIIDPNNITLIDKIAHTLKNYRLKVTDYGGYNEAVVTAGGVALTNVDPQTMQSKIVKGLYFAGEVLDIDADTGGYNLQLAFSTGFTAGKIGI